MWIVDALLSVFTLNKHDTYAGDGVCDDNDDNGLRNNNDSAALRDDLIREGPGFQDYYDEAGTLFQRLGSPRVAASLLNISQPVKEVSTMGYLNSTTDNRTLVFTEGTTTQSNIEPTTNATDPKTTNRPPTTTDGPDGGLNTGEIVGIAVGATVGALIIIGAIVYVVKKNKKKNENKVSSTTSEIVRMARFTLVF
ncbi:unnamed protein product [Clavelina lepadiformis]|uniref:Uncharacterized protein n=1 Tax=Clavelina lepadiformis TaxID=159417 RepID=A0ABP0F2Y4_CLALP